MKLCLKPWNNASGSLIRFIPELPIPPFARWAWYELENKLQTPYGTSSPHISWVFPRLLLISMCAPHLGRVLSVFFSFPVGHFCDGHCASEVAGVSGNISTLRCFGFAPMEAAGCGSAARLLTALWTGEPPGAVMFQWLTSAQSATNRRQSDKHERRRDPLPGLAQKVPAGEET